MYLDFDDRPDVPRLVPALTTLERILLVAVGYLLIVVIYLVTPASFWEVSPVADAVPVAQAEMPRFVHIETPDRIMTPKKPAEASDLDRRAATIERAPKPENDAPKSTGNTPEKFNQPPPEPKGADDPPQPAGTPSNTSPSGITSKIVPESPPRPDGPPPGVLSRALHNLQSYLQNQNFDNAQGGNTEQGADIQFDSKGVDFGSWLRRFRAQVYSNWLPYIPNAAEYQKGDVVIQLDIHRDGSITNLRIVRSSGHPPLDNAAFNSLKLSNPTVPLPTAFPDEVAPFTVTFRYLLR